MQDYSRPMVDFVELRFSIFIAKRFFNGKTMSSNLAFMPVVNKIGKKVKKFIERLFFGKKITKDDLTRVVTNLYSKS